MNDDLISRSALKEAFTEAYAGITFSLIECNDIIDNAPTVEDITEDDIKEAIKTGYRDGYDMAKAKYEKPTEIDCSKCDYLKFSKSFIESVVKLMNTYGIESVEDLSRELKHIANGGI